MDCKEEELQALYMWVDSIPLSRPKRSIARDFADGVLTAEVVHHYFPKLVELHNYSGAHGLAQKLYNWSTLNARVFRRLGFVVARAECEAVALCEPGAVERVLKLVRTRIAEHAERQRQLTEPAGAAGDEPAAQGQACLQCGTAPVEAPARDPDAGVAAGAAPPAAATAAARVTLRPGGGGRLLKQLRGGGDGAPAGARGRAGAAGAGVAGGPADPQAADELRHALLELHETRELNEARLARCSMAILEAKTRKLEQLLRLKDAKIAALEARLHAAQPA